MASFAAGVIRFQNEIYPQKKALFEKLSLGQTPEALFITCADSRIETAMITQTDPGELFICRNAGNIVPPHMEKGGGMTASIEYAVSSLHVPHVVICGHTECGAMKGAMQPDQLGHMPHVQEWLGYAQPAVAATGRLGPFANEADRLRILTEQNVILQLDHLKGHPSVAKRLAQGNLTLHGWVYDIRTGDVGAYDETRAAFVPVDQRYADMVAEFTDAERR